MPATRDRSQNIAFIYENLYQVYQMAKKANLSPEQSHEITQARVIRPMVRPEVKIREYQPVEFIGCRVKKPAVLKQNAEAKKGNRSDAAILDLKKNLKSLNSLHSRLRFMLQELEDLVDERDPKKS